MAKIPNGYKKTEIGVIPEDWMVRSVGEIFKVTRGQVLSVKLVSQVTNSLNRYPVYSSQTVNDGLVGYYDSYLYENAITWTTDGANAGIVNYRRGKFYCTNVCGVLLNSQGFANLFMAHKIGSVSKSYVSYVGNPKLMNNVVDKILVAIPPLEEQIAYSQKMSDIESLIVSTEKLIEKKRNIKQGVMQELLTGKRRLAGFNGEWKSYKLGSVVGRITTGKLDANAMNSNGLYRFYTCAKDFYYIDTYAFDAEALLISGNGANVGYIHYYKGKFNAYQRTYVLTDFKQNIFFTKLFMDKNLQERIRIEVNAGNTPYITLNTLSDMLISFPPTLEEQKQIAEVINEMEKGIYLLESKLSKLKQIKQGAMQQLLTGKIRLINK